MVSPECPTPGHTIAHHDRQHRCGCPSCSVNVAAQRILQTSFGEACPAETETGGQCTVGVTAGGGQVTVDDFVLADG
jgi:hypothetical protein